MRVLVAEDEPRVAEAVARGLRREGAAVDVALDGRSALAKARAFDYDVVVLDRDLPDTHGDEVCRAVNRDLPDTRILMLTAYGEVDDLVAGLALGADDYVAKPFAFDELVARVRALARRAHTTRPAVLERGGVRLDPARREVARGGKAVELTPKEFAVLEALLEADGDVVSARRLLDRVWDENIDAAEQHGPDDRHDAAPEARRAGGDRNRARRRLPHLMLPRPTIRLRLTALYAVVVFIAGGLLLAVSYALLDGHLHNTLSDADRRLRPGPAQGAVPARAARGHRPGGAARLGDRRARARSAAHHRDRRPLGLGRVARAARGPAWPGRRAARARGHVRRDARAARLRVREPEALRRGRLARAADTAHGAAHRGRGRARGSGRDRRGATHHRRGRARRGEALRGPAREPARSRPQRGARARRARAGRRRRDRAARRLTPAVGGPRARRPDHARGRAAPSSAATPGCSSSSSSTSSRTR